MRITDPEIIRTGENDLINSIKNDLDWDAVKSIIKNRINMVLCQINKLKKHQLKKYFH